MCCTRSSDLYKVNSILSQKSGTAPHPFLLNISIYLQNASKCTINTTELAEPTFSPPLLSLLLMTCIAWSRQRGKGAHGIAGLTKHLRILRMRFNSNATHLQKTAIIKTCKEKFNLRKKRMELFLSSISIQAHTLPRWLLFSSWLEPRPRQRPPGCSRPSNQTAAHQRRIYKAIQDRKSFIKQLRREGNRCNKLFKIHSPVVQHGIKDRRVATMLCDGTGDFICPTETQYSPASLSLQLGGLFVTHHHADQLLHATNFHKPEHEKKNRKTGFGKNAGVVVAEEAVTSFGFPCCCV